ncbi:MAG: hypothetical protein AXW15_02360 [Neptuniibacter sp. Phe_28]|jgi:dihydrofolate reductase|nr:MAG: hypothetical protein AXW15_02360 [Neptuniibacter sp. Phe_28]
MTNYQLERFEVLVIQHQKAKIEADKERASLRSAVQTTEISVLIGSFLATAFFDQYMSDVFYVTIQLIGVTAFIALFFNDRINTYLSRDSRILKNEYSLFCDVCDEYEKLSPELKREADKIRDKMRM